MPKTDDLLSVGEEAQQVCTQAEANADHERCKVRFQRVFVTPEMAAEWLNRDTER